MIINFTKLSPGGNDTIIVQSAVPAAERAVIARKLMSSPHVGGEQVGYLTLAPVSGIDARLDMMGGELCVNALRSAATVLAGDSEKANLRLASSGTDEIFELVSVPHKGSYYTSITLNIAPRIKPLAESTLIVHLNGISHLLYEVAPEAAVEPLNVFTELRQKYDNELGQLPAFGIIPFRRSKEDFEIFPVVYVRETDTVIPETGCGSGSLALALALDKTNNNGICTIFQPSGYPYAVEISREAEKTKVRLGSEVHRLKHETTYID